MFKFFAHPLYTGNQVVKIAVVYSTRKRQSISYEVIVMDNIIIGETVYSGSFPKTIRAVLSGIGTQYSCASAAVGCGDTVFLKLCAGNRQDFSGTVLHNPDPKPVTPDTLYDMASVSKLMSTTMAALRMLEDGGFSLYDSLCRYFDDCGNFANVEIRHLMTHTSGISPHIPLYLKCKSPDEAIPTILRSEPVCGIGERVNYSCMGYIILQRILEKITGKALDILARELVFEPLGMRTACYNPKTDDVAATEYSPLNHYYICGHVHDENAHFMGGVSGNAGVFASLDDSIKFASMLSNRGISDGKIYLGRHVFDAAVYNHTKNLNEARGLGFAIHGGELSVSGELADFGTYGHNGYTGTSVYVDGRTGVYVVLLTNSVHYGRDNRAAFFRARRILHNIAFAESDRII